MSDKVYGTYEYFGEASLLLEAFARRTSSPAQASSATPSRKTRYLRLIRYNTEVEKQILTARRPSETAGPGTHQDEPLFQEPVPPRKHPLESILSNFKLGKGDPLFRKRDDKNFVYILASGGIYETRDGEKYHDLDLGDFLYDHFDFEEENGWDKNYVALTDCELYRIQKTDYLEFLGQNPGIKMKIIYGKRK